MSSIKEQILGVLKSRNERLEEYFDSAAENVITERTAIEGVGRGGAFDYHTLAKQYVESTVKQLLDGKSGNDINLAFDKAINSVVYGIKSTFVGNKKINNTTLLNAAKKDPRIAKLLRIDSLVINRLNNRLDKAGVTGVENMNLAMKGPVLTQRYAMFSDAVRAIAADKYWIKQFKNTLVASSDKGADFEGAKKFKPTGKGIDLKKYSVDDKTEGDQGNIGKNLKKYSVDDKTEGDQGNIGKHLKEEFGSEGDGGEIHLKKKASCDTSTKKASCNASKKKKASVDTEEEQDADAKEKKSKKKKQEKAWNGIKQFKNFNY